MKTPGLTAMRVGLGKACLLLALLCCAPAPANAAMAARDEWARAGRLAVQGADWRVVFSKDDPAVVFSSDEQTVRIAPFSADGAESDGLLSCQVAKADPKEHVEIRAAFSAGTRTIEGRFRFTDVGDVQILPARTMAGVAIQAPISVGVLPGMKLEAVLYRPEDYPEPNEILVPCENWLAGLLKGNNGIVACAWPEGGQTVSLLLEGVPGARQITAIKLGLDGKDLHLALLTAPGIWHNERLQLTYLEKNVEIAWKRPFSAGWATQLPLNAETTTPRTFRFGERRRNGWLPEVGWYVLPAWFEGDRTFVHLSKKIPPRGEAVIYPMEGNERSLMGFARRTPLGRMFAERKGRIDLPQGPRNAVNVGYNACWGTYLLRRSIYKFGAQEREKEFLREHADFLADHAAQIQMRNAGYATFIKDMRSRLNAWLGEQESNPKVRAYLGLMLEHVKRVEDGHRQKMVLFDEDTPEQHIARADRTAERLKQLLETPGTEVFPECYYLVDTFNRLSWDHSERTGMRFCMLTHEWARQAARACAGNPGALEYAREIRGAIRQALRAAPGY